MEFLDIHPYDAKRMRCLCPFHREDTPSFIYNPKAYQMHCFGCNINVDVIDALMKGQNKTFLEAVQKLFDLAGEPYSFGEYRVRTKRSYRYPVPVECTDKTQAYRYLASRKISAETADYLDIRQDAGGNLAFPYYDLNDTLTMVKYRPARKIRHGENKNWCQKGADTAPLLFNMNRVNPAQPLVICCGELDCAALMESGIQNAVSIPMGDGNTHWIEECWEFLEQFQELVLVHDNDASGHKFIQEVVPRLGSWRCRVASCPEVFVQEDGREIPIKDVNETLFWYGKEKVKEVIAGAKDTPVPSVIDFTQVEDVDLSEMEGISTGFVRLDQELMRLFYGNLHLVTGMPGAGKTSFLYQLVCNAMDAGCGAWIFSRELPQHMTRNWINFLLAGPRNLEAYRTAEGVQYWRVKGIAKQMMNEAYQGRLYLYKDDCGNTAEEIESSMEDSARKYGCRFFLLDNLMAIDLGGKESELANQTAFVMWLNQFSAKYQVCTVLVTHPRKIALGQERVEMYDIAGSSNLVNLAHRVFGLKRVTKKEKEGIRNKRGDGWEKAPCPYDETLDILKDRMRGGAEFELGLYYDKPSRRFYTSPEEYGRQYSWDRTDYKTPLSYPPAERAADSIAKGKGT